MTEQHPKRKGTIGEGIVMLELLQAGIPVFQEFGDLSRVDLKVPQRLYAGHPRSVQTERVMR